MKCFAMSKAKFLSLQDDDKGDAEVADYTCNTTEIRLELIFAFECEFNLRIEYVESAYPVELFVFFRFLLHFYFNYICIK